MGDVANILGVQPQRAVSTAAEEATKILAAKPVSGKITKLAKPKGMSREVYSLMGPDSIAPLVPANSKLMSGLKDKRTSKVHGKWVWAPFKNSARRYDCFITIIYAYFTSRSHLYLFSDGHEFHHWVKASMEYPDYPYAKFNIKIEAVMYSNEEYEVLLQSSQWNRSETDHLMDLCYQYDLRWPVIVDRYSLLPPRTLDEIRSRYYYVVARLKRSRTGVSEEVIKSEANVTLDIDFEKQRRANLELMFRKTKEDEVEEAQLKEELKSIDAALKKSKKSTSTEGGDSKNSNKSGQSRPGKNSAGSNSSNSIASTGTALYAYDPKIPPMPHVPSARRPYLQSTRLIRSDPSSTEISKSRLKKMDLLLRELGLPENMIPTRAVCDLYDEVCL